jgi:hypothetical protein
VEFFGLMMALGLPLAFFLGVGGGLLWALFGRLPGWFFPVALAFCLVIAGFAEARTRSLDPNGDDFETLIPTFLIPLNLMFAAPVLVLGWVAQVWHGRNRRAKALSFAGRRDPAS